MGVPEVKNTRCFLAKNRVLFIVLCLTVQTAFNSQGILDPHHPEVQHDKLLNRSAAMGKYILGWILGIPMVVLVVIYLIAN